jgi:hypothetical protein
MKSQARKPTPWGVVREKLAAFPKPALVAIIKDLYDVSAENRGFLDARFQFEEANGTTLESYRKKIVEQFYPARGFGKLKLGDAKKAVRVYRKATGDNRGTAELLMTFVENGTDFTRDFGDIDERFYTNVESALDDLMELIREDPKQLYPIFAKRLAEVDRKAEGIGWGFGDYVTYGIAQLVDEMKSEAV